jgi:hypothetical protein
MSLRAPALSRAAIRVTTFLALAGLPRTARAQKTFIDYFQPTPIICPLTTNTWGCTASGATPANCTEGMGVVPRDTCNGIESPKNPPAYYYWDGKVIRASDGTYHLFADRWSGSAGFAAWTSSDPIHATGDGGVLGPFTDNGFAYSDGSFGSDPHHGHNSSVVELLDGTFALVVSEVVPFTIFTSQSLDGPWTPCSNNPGSGLSVPGTGFGGNNTYGSNVSLVARPDGDFEIIQRHGLIALSTVGVCGPYDAQQPTNAYPSNEAIPSASAASIYPNRQKHLDSLAPATVESTYSLAEDPVIWFSGGFYHVLYDYPDDRVGYLLTSTDGIHDWTDRGLAYDPRYAQQIFSYTDGTVDHWYKMERPGVVIENGIVTHVTFAVSDVDKNDQIPANSDHGSKVIVVPFDGADLDCDIAGGACDAGAAGGPDSGGAVPHDAGGVRDATVDAGDGQSGGMSGAVTSGASSSGNSSGAVTTGASSSGTSGAATSGASSGGNSSGGSAGSTPASGSGGNSSNSGCACMVGPGAAGRPPAGGLVLASGLAVWRRTRARRRRSQPVRG